MRQTIEVLRHVGLGVFVGLTIVCARQWRARTQPALRWATIAFGSLAAIGLIGLVMQQQVFRGLVLWLIKGLLAVLILFPYFLYRFAVAFQRPSRLVMGVARAVTLIAVAYSLAIPRLVLPGMPQPAWLTVYRGVILAQWTILFCIIASQLWWGAKGQTTVPRRRMRTLALASLGMNVAILLSGIAAGTPSERMRLVTQVLSLGSSILFFVGLAPPAWLVHIWRRPEMVGFQGAMRDLFAATSQAEVSRILLPHAVRVIGARGAALVSGTGTLLATHGTTDAPENIVALALSKKDPDTPSVHRVAFRTGAMLIWTSPYAPFFSQSEFAMLDGWGLFVDLALERSAAAERQRMFIANAAHELRTPLTTILGVASTLADARGSLTEAQVQDCLQALERQGARAVLLIRNLLDLAQLDGERLATSIETITVSGVVQHAMEAAPPPPGINVTVKVAPDIVAEADPDRLEQILVNLLSNAYRYGGPDVLIETREEPDGIVLVVSDAGPGVPEELVPHLFEPFTRGNGARASGSGLGLALSKRLAEAIAGSMWYSPASPRGASFSVRLRRSA